MFFVSLTFILNVTKKERIKKTMLENYIYMIVEEITLTPEKLLILTPIFIFMLMASRIDMAELRIPNQLNLSMFILRLMVAFVYPIGSEHILGFIFGGLFILIPAMIILKPMGGDIKFLAVLGFWIGDIPIFITMIFATIFFIVYAGIIKKKGRKESMAFAPFMSIACTLLMCIGLILHFVNV